MDHDSIVDGQEAAPDINPYRSPAGSSSDNDALNAEGKLRRPLGIAILAVLHGLGSLGLFAIAGFLIWNHSEGGLNLLIGSGAEICSCLGFASAYGMWTGAKWGWWLSSWYYLTDAVGHVLALCFTPLLQRRPDEEALQEFFLKHSVRFVVSLLLAIYFFRRKVLRYFGLQSLNRWKAIGILIGLGLAFHVLLSIAIATYFISTRGLPPALR